MSVSKILFVDDDRAILETFERALALDYEVATAGGGQEGLMVLEAEGPFAVVVSDMRMPHMDGVAFLSEVRKRWPDTVRVMLTGYADMDAAVAAVNEGQVFRFMTKPCPADTLISALEMCLNQYRLQQAEKELLRGTLRGSVRMLAETLAIVRPEIYGRAMRIQPYVKRLSRKLGDPAPWLTETASLLAFLGYISLPERIVAAAAQGNRLMGPEAREFHRHVEVAEKLLLNIPRMDGICRIIRYQNKNYDGTGFPEDAVKGDAIPLGARILHVLIDFDAMGCAGAATCDAFQSMKHRLGLYDPEVLLALESVLGDEAKYLVKTLKPGQLARGMIVSQDVVVTREGKEVKVIGRGQELNDATIEYINQFAESGELIQPITVIIPS